MLRETCAGLRSSGSACLEKTALAASGPSVAQSLNTKGFPMAMSTDVAHSWNASCSQTTQATVTTGTIGTQCALVGLLVSSSSQTYDEFPAQQELQYSSPVDRSALWNHPWTVLAQTMDVLEKPASSLGLEVDNSQAGSLVERLPGPGGGADITAEAGFHACSCRMQSDNTGSSSYDSGTIQSGGKLHSCPSCQHNHPIADGASKEHYSCPVCNKVFRRKWNRDSHMKVHTGEKPYVCGTCQKSFGYRSRLIRHEKVHSGEKPYLCGTCQKRFASRTNLLSHEKLHSGEKPHMCRICQRSFARRSHLIIHERVHSGEKPYVCSTCQKSFPQRSELIYHERVHSGERPYMCSTCQKSFTRRSHLVEHEKSLHSGEKPYVCSTCQKSFPKRNQVIIHERMHALCQGALPM